MSRRMPHRLIASPAFVALLATALGGCASSSSPSTSPPPSDSVVSVATTMPATAAIMRPAEPPRVSVSHHDFNALWRAAESAARHRLFPIDRRDYRGGVLKTEAVISKQAFEPWRRDAVTAGDVAESSLATVRRTITFTFDRNDAGDTYTVTPAVLVERYAQAEQRLTSAALYRAAFRRNPDARGSREADRGINLPQRYWYELGRDAALEKDLAEAIRARVR